MEENYSTPNNVYHRQLSGTAGGNKKSPQVSRHLNQTNEGVTTKIQANAVIKFHKDCISQEWNGAAVYCSSDMT